MRKSQAKTAGHTKDYTHSRCRYSIKSPLSNHHTRRRPALAMVRVRRIAGFR